jgi:hypothetical protein
MVHSCVRFLFLALIVVAIVVPLSPAQTCGSVDRVMTALRLTRILYGEVEGEELDISFSEGHGSPLLTPTDGAGVGIAIDRPVRPAPAKSDDDPSTSSHLLPSQDVELEMPLYLDFDFVETGAVARKVACRPLKFMNNKTSKRMLEAAQVINDHPEWTDAEDVEAARKLGMRFGPDKKNELLRILPLKGLSSVYGPLQITEANFRTAGPKEPGSYFADLHWYITAKHKGSLKMLKIMVEPFNGKITALSE